MRPTPTAERRAVTQRELAEMLNVSQMTVSRALRGTDDVRPEVASAIRAAAGQQGYSAESHFSARAMQGKRHGRTPATNVICGVVYETGEGDRSFNGRILHGIQQAVEADGNEFIVAPNVRKQHLPRVVTRRQVDGVVWLLADLDFVVGMPHCSVPWVSILFDVPEADAVLIDNIDGGRLLGEHLAALGHRRVAFIGPESGLARERLAGLRAGLAPAGGQVPDEYVVTEQWASGESTTVPLVRRLMSVATAKPVAERFTAVAVYNDYMAGFVIRALEAEYGRRVPQEVSVTGFDALEHVPGTTRRITTAAIPLEELGMTATRLLEWRMANPQQPRRQQILHTKLVAGETTAQVQSGRNAS